MRPSADSAWTRILNDAVQAVAFTRQGEQSEERPLLATGSCSSEVRLYDVQTGENILIIEHGNWVNNIVFSPNGRLIAVGGRD